jgi:hypothetical protein
MATITVLHRSDLLPVGQAVDVRPAAAEKDGTAPTTTAVASGTVDATGTLTITSGSLSVFEPYVLHALVGSAHRYLRVRAI